MTKTLAALLMLVAGCSSRPGYETLPVVHVICPMGQGQGIDAYMTRAQFEKLQFLNIPCLFEWGETFPAPPMASPTATVIPSPSPDATP